MILLKWKVKQGSSTCGGYLKGMPKGIRDKTWIDITVSSEEECTVQVELSRKSLTGKVCTVVTIAGHK